jgi:hypothetical protein
MKSGGASLSTYANADRLYRRRIGFAAKYPGRAGEVRERLRFDRENSIAPNWLGA